MLKLQDASLVSRVTGRRIFGLHLNGEKLFVSNEGTPPTTMLNSNKSLSVLVFVKWWRLRNNSAESEDRVCSGILCNDGITENTPERRRDWACLHLAAFERHTLGGGIDQRGP